MARSDPGFREKKKNHRGYLQRTFLIAAGLILGLGFCRWNAAASSGDTPLMPFGFGIAAVLSGSMSPTLEVNDLVVIQERDSYEPGDIIVYQSGHSLVVHRMIAREENYIIAKGDANDSADAPIDSSAVKGLVVFSVPFLGAAMMLLKTPVARVVLLVGAFFLMALSLQKGKQTEEVDMDAVDLDAVREEIRRLKSEQASREKSDRKES